MRILFNGFLIVSLFFVLASCSNRQYQVLFEQQGRLDSVTKHGPASGEDYRIKPQDILQIRNLQNLSYIVDATSSASGVGGGTTAGSGQQYQVEADGSVALPVIGRVPVAGLNREQAREKVEKLYRDTLLKDPIIELKIVNLKVTMLGEIKSQGNFPLVKDKTTLVEMIGEAGGLSDKANEKNIEIIRGNEKKPEVIHVDLTNILAINDPSTVLQNGDIVYISQNKRAIRSDNLSNFSIFIQPALLFLNTFLVIYTLAHR